MTIVSMHLGDPRASKEVEAAAAVLQEALMKTSSNLLNQRVSELSQEAVTPEQYNKMLEAIEEAMK